MSVCLQPVRLLCRSSHLTSSSLRALSTNPHGLALKTLLLSGPPLEGPGSAPLHRSPVSSFPTTWRSTLRPAASLSRASSLPSTSGLLPVFPIHTTRPPSPASPRGALVFPPTPRCEYPPKSLHSPPTTTPPSLPEPPPVSFSLLAPFPPLQSPPSQPSPSSLFSSPPPPHPLTGLHPPPPPPPSSAPSPNSLGLAARPLSQQSGFLSSSACGRLTSQSRPRAALVAPPRRLLGSVVLRPPLPNLRPAPRELPRIPGASRAGVTSSRCARLRGTGVPEPSLLAVRFGLRKRRVPVLLLRGAAGPFLAPLPLE